VVVGQPAARGLGDGFVKLDGDFDLVSASGLDEPLAYSPLVLDEKHAAIYSEWTGDRSRWFCALQTDSGPPTARSIQRRPPARLQSPSAPILGPPSPRVLRAR